MSQTDPQNIAAIVGAGFPRHLGTSGDVVFGGDAGGEAAARWNIDTAGRLFIDFDPPGTGQATEDPTP